ncbi:hypothetical protein K470DRAFT_219213 [Piedraia hortae CBS 480.64]|uniref:ML-like domain-containing protein n=1 Tax=Piedraia hortae CBS 480.64 TaxID=1314780 RepID=A0A6A7BVY5_9PEZI|nr:hypothetical protein K470DRAFT_219213 [Piedraia hortae CBS 480.64]
MVHLRLLTLVLPCAAVFIPFENCLPSSIIISNPKRLQFTPLFVDASLSRESKHHVLTATVYGNVSGQQFDLPYPPPDSPQWKDPKETLGKIVDVGTANKYSTILSSFSVLSYGVAKTQSGQFCRNLTQGHCPLAPSFDANASEPTQLPAFRVVHDFNSSSFAFGSIRGSFRIVSGDEDDAALGCVRANATPDLGPTLRRLLWVFPALILALKGVATLAAAIWSPWGSSDIFRWSSNYGRDEDQLRLVTPGFGDCLQYIQFVALTGALSLQYPGFYRPIVSHGSWSVLLFNQSLVSGGNGSRSLVDGLYAYNGSTGMAQFSQLVGMSSIVDVWACMAVWLLVIAGSVFVACQLFFGLRHAYRSLARADGDRRNLNLPFTGGCMVRLLSNFFILPIVALSLYQLVVAAKSPISVVVCAVVLLVLMFLAAAWILRVIFTTKPRDYLFDDMPTVLLYGPLYNTYSDSAAPFALVPVFITFVRGVGFGALQPSGIAQIIFLAICEVILVLTLNGFRPFQGQTSMNAYHTAFAVTRLVTVLLSAAFVPSLGVGYGAKGWIAYIILLCHASVLLFGFFLNALQTLLEVVARSCGFAGDPQTGAIRGSILNMRMLKNRQDRRLGTGDRGSLTSNTAILQDVDARSGYGGSRSRSISASSQLLLRPTPTNRISSHDVLYDPTLESNKSEPDVHTFYRPPRARTDDMPGAMTRNAELAELPVPDERRTTSGTASPAPPAFIRDSDSPRPDYAVREVDQYYGTSPMERGPALSSQPTRKLKTGPVDPEGAAANAQSWFRRFLVGSGGNKKKAKEPSKGFEVIRSSRAPLQQGDVEMQSRPRYDEGVDSPTEAGAERKANLDVKERDLAQPTSTQASPQPGNLDGAGHQDNLDWFRVDDRPESPPLPRRSSRRRESRDIGNVFEGF